MKRRQDVSESFAALMALFESELDGVAFPLVDIDILRAAAQRCEQQQLELADAERVVADARAGLAREQDELSSLIHKAVAYLRVYAADDEALAVKVNAVDPQRRKPKPRTREAAKSKPRATKNGPQAVEAAPSVAKAS